LRAAQIQPHEVGLGRGQFRFGLRHIHLAVGAAGVEGFDQGEVFFAQFNRLGHDVPVQVNGPNHKISLRDIGLKGEQDVLVGGGAGLGLFARGPEGAPDAPPKVNLVAQIQRQERIGCRYSPKQASLVGGAAGE
jgi:hypothetical protein